MELSNFFDELQIDVKDTVLLRYKERPRILYRLQSVRLTDNVGGDDTLVCVITAEAINEGEYKGSRISATSDKFEFVTAIAKSTENS